MTSENCIIHARTINRDGTCTVLTDGHIAEKLKSKDLAWVHLDAEHPDTRSWLLENVDYLDPLIVDALLAEETRPRVVEIDKGALLILRGVNLNENAEPEDMVSVRLWIDEHRIISMRRRKLKAVIDIREKLEAGNGPKDSGEFLSMLAARLFERMEPVLTELDERTDNVEERVMDDPRTEERKEIIDIRREAIIFRRYIAPQRDVLMYLRTSELRWLGQHDRRRMQESLDRVTRYIEDLDMIRERAQIVKDELANALADRLNKNMYVLSVIAAIFLPLGFLTGLLGINIGGMPGADDPQAFWVFTGGLTILVAIQIALFKKLKWF